MMKVLKTASVIAPATGGIVSALMTPTQTHKAETIPDISVCLCLCKASSYKSNQPTCEAM